MEPELSDSNLGFCGMARWGLPSAWAAAKDTQASTPRGFDNLLTGSGGRLCRGALSSGAFRHYLSGYAAVEATGEEIAAAHADGRPQRDSMRIDTIAQFRF
jgi:hypothetical protein